MQEDQVQNVSDTDNESAVETETVATAPESAEAAESSGSAEQTERVPHRKTRTGLVVSDKMQKSIVVKVTRRVRHPLYKKYFYKSKKYMVHDENDECNVGDTVRIIETRPLSARKRWRLDAIVERAK